MAIVWQLLGSILMRTMCCSFIQAESVVNAGPAVFISPSGPNPMMVQVRILTEVVVYGGHVC